MKHRLGTVLTILAIASWQFATPAVAMTSGFQRSERGWKKVFDCEFDSPEDLKKWQLIDPDGYNSNDEKQAYVTDAYRVQDGMLYIDALKRDGKYGGKEYKYTSGQLITKGKFDCLYGRYDIRFKIPRGKGFWPAFWLLPANGDWPPEIDWIETLGHDTRTLYMTNHYGKHENGDHPSSCHSKRAVSPDFSEGFHTLSGVWEKDRIIWYVDGNKAAESRDGVPQQNMYMLLNLAVGGGWPGDPDETTTFPNSLVVDYVRVYQRQ